MSFEAVLQSFVNSSKMWGVAGGSPILNITFATHAVTSAYSRGDSSTRGIARRCSPSVTRPPLSLNLSLRPPHQSHSFHDVFIIAAAASRLRPSVRGARARRVARWAPRDFLRQVTATAAAVKGASHPSIQHRILLLSDELEVLFVCYEYKYYNMPLFSRSYADLRLD